MIVFSPDHFVKQKIAIVNNLFIYLFMVHMILNVYVNIHIKFITKNLLNVKNVIVLNLNQRGLAPVD